ncbi:MAG: squalene cyclase [Desulfovibrionaceae bacterium]|nr:squalene cyclase [Desulfovibrionaceae bacterium]
MYSEDTHKLSGVEHRLSHNNLHITCQKFEEEDAQGVIGLVYKFHHNCDRIFIDVRKAETPSSKVASHFKTALAKSSVSPRQIFFKGQKGFDLAIDGNRVLLPQTTPHADKPKHVCCGKCAHCHCKHDH